jgi:hypothetical protein
MRPQNDTWNSESTDNRSESDGLTYAVSIGRHVSFAEAVLLSHSSVLTCLGVTEARNTSSDCKSQEGNNVSLLQG